jgi:hypothetical protein
MKLHTFVYDAYDFNQKPKGYIIAKDDHTVLVQHGPSVQLCNQLELRYRRSSYPSWLSPDEWMVSHFRWRLLDLFGTIWNWPEPGLRALTTNRSLKHDEILYLVRTLSSSGSIYKTWGPRFQDWMRHPQPKLLSAEEREAYIPPTWVLDAKDRFKIVCEGQDLKANMQL